MENSTKLQQKYRNDIQGLRAVAVLSVFIFHLNNHFLSGGFIGVDVFFVISGFLVSGIILRQKDKNIFSFKEFYIGRIKRIVPAYYILIVLILIVGSLFIILPTDVYAFRNNAFWATIFNSNHFLSTQDNYFGMSSSENALLHTWTLSLEMQVYFILPFVIFFINKKHLIKLFIISIFIVLAYTEYQILFANNQSGVYFSLLCRFPEFILGAMLNLINFNKVAINRYSSILGIIGLTLILLSCIFINGSLPFPGLLALPACLGTCLIIISEKGVVSKFLSLKPLSYIGELSYSMYLWHWPVLAFYRYYYSEYTISIKSIPFLVAIIFLLSYLSFRFIESYYRKKSTKNFIYTFACIPILIVLLLALSKPIIVKLHNIDEYYSTPTSLIGWSTHSKEYSKDIVRGDLAQNDTILLLGDSHALGFATVLDEISKDRFMFRSITCDRYPSIPGLELVRYPKLGDTILEIESSQLNIESYKRMSSIAEQFIPKARIIFFVKSYTTNLIPSMPKALDDLVSKLSPSQHLIIVSDYPSLDKNPIKINRGITRQNQRIIKSFMPKIPDELYQIEHKYNNVHILDLSNSLAFKDVPFCNDTIMYYDEGHLNNYGLKKYAEYSKLDIISIISASLNK